MYKLLGPTNEKLFVFVHSSLEVSRSISFNRSLAKMVKAIFGLDSNRDTSGLTPFDGVEKPALKPCFPCRGSMVVVPVRYGI